MSVLVIRQAQMAQFEGHARALAERRAVAHLERHFPAEWRRLPQADRIGLVERYSRRAGELGAGQHDTLRLLALGLLYGEGFADQDWVQSMLGDAAIKPAERVGHLHSEALRRAAKAAASARAREIFEHD